LYLKKFLKMKKFVTLIFAAVLCTNAFANEWIFGIEAGGNIAYIDGQGKMAAAQQQYDLTSNRVIGGAFIGGTAQYAFDSWGLRGELYYSQQGSVYTGYVTNTLYGSVFRRSNYINVPIMGYISFGRFTVMAGPSFNFCVSGRDYFKDWTEGAGVPSSIAWSPSGFNVFDFALSVGLEFMIWDCAGLFIRYNHGFCDQFTASSIVGYETTPAYGKNRVGQIGIIYKFGQ